ncbi:50S ribosomal protein L20 [Methylacidimicrobium tartarophylax]|uniref:Large ribosomal subunit protein bL20 n=1 Tax=Methylacidimicrobium tartarophylax TaxID=1041768 RepID=A0A5E6MJN8_9BACT|nr:50S ribosomal protein L20 [Methylacidimicrobium tartarophylax]VVM06287.1 50S ribosomal protein L20 [Methylacidimicrobium tartarophylax]
MARATNAPASRERRRRVVDQASGFRGRRSKLYRYAKDAIFKAKYWSYRDRKTRKREFRSLWIARINAAARAEGMTYSRLWEGLMKAGIAIDRKVMADLAVRSPAQFSRIVSLAKEKVRPPAVPAA